MKQIIKNQAGIAHLAFIAVIAGVAIIAFVGGSVYSSQQKRQEAARNAAIEQEKKAKELEAKTTADNEKVAVEVPATAEEQKPAPVPAPAPKPAPAPAPKTTTTVTKFTIETTLAEVGADNVVLTAKLGKVYSGTCEAMVKLPDGSNAQWFKQTFASADTCSVTVSRAKLVGHSEWKFYMYYYNDPKNITVKGTSSGNLFTLPE
jgi:type IV secretory pathway VirB10-like protein